MRRREHRLGLALGAREQVDRGRLADGPGGRVPQDVERELVDDAPGVADTDGDGDGLARLDRDGRRDQRDGGSHARSVTTGRGAEQVLPAARRYRSGVRPGTGGLPVKSTLTGRRHPGRRVRPSPGPCTKACPSARGRGVEGEDPMVAEPVPFKARIPVYVSAADPLSRAGIVSQLRRAQGFAVVAEGELPDDVVGLVVGDELDAEVLAAMRALRGRGVRRVVLLVSRVDDRSLLAAAEAGVTGRAPPLRGDPGQPVRDPALRRGRRGHAAAGPARAGCCARSGSSSARSCRRAG